MKLIFLFISIVFSSILCYAQTDSTTTTATDSLPKKKSTFTIATVYANNASYYGQRAAEATPYIALSATYQFKSGIYINGLAYKILTENNPDISAANLGAGINFKLSKKIAADISYTHSFYPSLSPLMQSVNTENASVGLTHKSWLETSITGDYAFGKTNDVFVTGGLAKDINLFSIGKKDVVSVKPSAQVVAGTQRFYKTYATEQKMRDSLFGIITGPIFGTPPADNNSTTVATNSFDLLSYNLEIPLSYNRAHYVLQAAYQLSVLSNKVQSGAGQTNSFFTLSFYYQF